MGFHIGQKVVCIRGHNEEAYAGLLPPLVGDIVTIREIDRFGGLLFDEVHNHKELCRDQRTGTIAYGEPSFWPERFRPLVAGHGARHDLAAALDA